MTAQWHTLSADAVLKEFNTGQHGLTSEDVVRRQAEHGPNRLPEGKTDSLLTIFLRQFASPLIYLLFAAAAILYVMGDHGDAYIILFVLLFNAVIGAVQEGRAQDTLRALKHFSETKATVMRDGREMIIPDYEIVPGDLLVLHEGMKVPADARVILSRNLHADESSLTGESEPVKKSTEAIAAAEAVPAEQTNMVFKGSTIPLGTGRAVVVATGSNTMLGAIAQKISSIDTDVPLKAAIARLSRTIIYVVAVVSVLLFFGGVYLGNEPQEMFAVVISLAVSVIPEGLPIVMTLVLATGVWRMGKRNVLVKKLQAVEALGAANRIAVDKTGTITRNELTTERIYTHGRTYAIGGAGYAPVGDVLLDGNVIDSANHPELLFAGKVAALSAASQVTYAEEEKRWQVSGDPTEAAILVAGQKIGFRKEDLEMESPLLFELSFDYVKKYHATLHQIEGGNLVSVVGAPEAIVALSSSLATDAGEVALDDAGRAQLQDAFATLSSDGLRVIAYATARVSGDTLDAANLPRLTFGGYFGMRDAIRPEAKDAVARAQAAGIAVVMITGDHVRTGFAIAKEVGIAKEGDRVLTGKEIDAMDDAALAEALAGVSVFARVTPEHKMRIITAYRARGEVVAMTGDGVNDAPPLVAADLGVAMGNVGTEVAKEAADIILLDDNFGSIVAGVEEGRSIYRSIRKVILYLFSTGVAEALAVILALVAGLPLPLLAAQIIWLNFVTDSFLVAALAMEPKERNLLSAPFTGTQLIDRGIFGRMILLGLPMALGTLYLFNDFIAPDLTKAWTISLTTLAVFQWANAWNCRSDTRSVFAMSSVSNPWLIPATALVVFLQILAVHWSVLQDLLHTTDLTLAEWGLCIVMGLSIIVVDEVRKLVRKIRVPQKRMARAYA